MSPRLHGIEERRPRIRWFRIPAMGSWSEIAENTLVLLNIIAMVDAEGLRTSPDETLTLFVQNSNCFSAPVGALQHRWQTLTSLDDYFGTRALWFMAEDLLKQCSEPTQERLAAVAAYIENVRETFAKYHSSVGNALSRPLVVQVKMPWEIRSTCPVPITVEVVELLSRDVV